MGSEASPLVRKFGSRIAKIAGDMPIADIGCGSGRNAVPLAELGCRVFCLDKDFRRFALRDGDVASRLICQRIDFLSDPWPFRQGELGGIINIHLFLPNLFPFFERSLASGKYLLFETPPGHGGNYEELPVAGAVRRALASGFEFEFFKESPVGPRSYEAVTTKVLAKRL